MSDEDYSGCSCCWCGSPAETHVHVTDITTRPIRDFKRYLCGRCQMIEDDIYYRLETRYGEVETDELNRRMKRALRRRGITALALEP